MIGTCRPREAGVYTVEGVLMISFDTRQIWTFKHGMMNGKTVVKLSRYNVRLYLSKEDFECDWKIIRRRNNDGVVADTMGGVSKEGWQ